MAATTFLESLNQTREFLANDFVEQPPTPPQSKEMDQDRVRNLSKLVQQAYSHAEGNPSSGKWNALPRLLRLGVTSGRGGRWIGARADLPTPQLPQSEEIREEEPEVPLQRWVPRPDVAERIQDWQKGVLPPSTEQPLDQSFDLSYTDPIAKSDILGSVPSSAVRPTSGTKDPLKGNHPLGFTVIKRTSQLAEKQSFSAKNTGGTQTNEETTARPLSSRGVIASIADIPDILSQPPPSFPSSQLVTSTPFTFRRPLPPPNQESRPAQPLSNTRPATPPRSPSSDIRLEDKGLSPTSALLPPHPIDRGSAKPLALTESLDAISDQRACAHITSSRPLPPPSPVGGPATPSKKGGSSSPLNDNGKRFRPDPGPNILEMGAQDADDAPSSKRSRVDVFEPPSPPTTRDDHTPSRLEASKKVPLTSPLPTLTELLASAKRNKAGQNSAKKAGDGSPRPKGLKSKKETSFRSISSIFAKIAKGTDQLAPPALSHEGDEKQVNTPIPSVLPAEATKGEVQATPTPAQVEEDENPFLEASALAIELIDLPVDLTSPTKSLSSIADSDSELGSDFGYDDKEGFGADEEELDELDEEEEEIKGGKRKPEQPKIDSQSLITSAFKFRPFATSTQKSAVHVSSSSPFRHLTASAPGSEAAGDGCDKKDVDVPPSTPAYASQSTYHRQIAKKVMDVNRVLDEDLDFGLKEGPSKPPLRRAGSDSDSDDDVNFEKEMSGWVRGASLDDELASP